MSKSLRHTLFLPSAFFLCVCSLTSLSLPVKCTSPRSETQSISSARGWSVTLKLTMPNGFWMRATEGDGGHVTIQRNKTVLTLFPHILNQNRLSLTARLVGNSTEGPIVRETSFEIETNAVCRPLLEWSRFGVAFDFEVESVQRTSVNRHSVQVSFQNHFDIGGGASGECCITCGGFTTCACAVEAPCGSCCTGLCCSNSGG
jgi:hypothetical protein